MTAALKVLSASVLGTSPSDLIAPVAGHASIVKTAVACNASSAPATFTVTVSKSGGSTVTVISAVTLAAGDSTSLAEIVGFFGPGDKISASAGTAAAISVVITGVDKS